MENKGSLPHSQEPITVLGLRVTLFEDPRLVCWTVYEWSFVPTSPPTPPPASHNDMFSRQVYVCHVAFCVVGVQQPVSLFSDCDHSRFLFNRRSNDSIA